MTEAELAILRFFTAAAVYGVPPSVIDKLVKMYEIRSNLIMYGSATAAAEVANLYARVIEKSQFLTNIGITEDQYGDLFLEVRAK